MKHLGHRLPLDGVRGIAILPVVGLHAFGWPRQGSLGVDLFFVLSGFLITTLLLQEQEETGSISFRSFYRRRALRLLPALIAMLGTFALATVISLASRGDLDASHLRSPLIGIAFALTYTANFAGAAGFHPNGLGHLWSLAEEEQFYLLWPAVLFLVVRARKETAIRILGVAVMLVVLERMILALTAEQVPLYRLYNGPDTHADPILIGCLSALALSTGRLPRWLAEGRPRSLAAAASTVFVVGAICFLDRAWILLYVTPLLTVFAAAVAVIVLTAALDDGLLSRALARGPIVFLGRISYSLYLWHVPILAFLGGWAGVALSLVAATASYHVVEQPFRRLKRRTRLGPTSRPVVVRL